MHLIHWTFEKLKDAQALGLRAGSDGLRDLWKVKRAKPSELCSIVARPNTSHWCTDLRAHFSEAVPIHFQAGKLSLETDAVRMSVTASRWNQSNSSSLRCSSAAFGPAPTRRRWALSRSCGVRLGVERKSASTELASLTAALAEAAPGPNPL